MASEAIGQRGDVIVFTSNSTDTWDSPSMATGNPVGMIDSPAACITGTRKVRTMAVKPDRPSSSPSPTPF